MNSWFSLAELTKSIQEEGLLIGTTIFRMMLVCIYVSGSGQRMPSRPETRLKVPSDALKPLCKQWGKVAESTDLYNLLVSRKEE